MSTVQRLPAALLAPLLTLMLLPVAISASASEPAQTTQQATISLVGDGPYYRLTLPTTIYAGAAHTDLRDVRVRSRRYAGNTSALPRCPATPQRRTS